MGVIGVGSCLKVGLKFGSVTLSDIIHKAFITLHPIFRTVSEDKDIPLRKEGLVR
jgi:hypothetical protein